MQVACEAMSTFSPVGLLSSDGLRMRVCVCLCTDSTGIIRNELICGYASVVHTSSSFCPHTCAHACMHSRMCARMCAHTHTHVHTHTHSHTIWGPQTHGAKIGHCHMWCMNICCTCLSFVDTDDYSSSQQLMPGHLSHELQSVLSYANVPLSQSAAYSNANAGIYNATTASAYGAPGQPVSAVSGYGSTVASGHPAQQMYSGKTPYRALNGIWLWTSLIQVYSLVNCSVSGSRFIYFQLIV